MKKTKLYTHSINIKLTDQQYSDFKLIKANSGKTISHLIRDNIQFLLTFYK